MVCDRSAVPLGVHVAAGQRNESLYAEKVLDEVCIGRRYLRPEQLVADRGYSFPRIRAWLKRHRIEAVIPERIDQRQQRERRQERAPHFDADVYRERNRIERLIGWMKECRRVATRFEKLALNFVAMIKLAMIRRCLRLLSDAA